MLWEATVQEGAPVSHSTDETKSGWGHQNERQDIRPELQKQEIQDQQAEAALLT